MKQDIKHRRLHAFFRSKVLNALMIVVIVSLLLMAYTKAMLLPVICGSTAFALFVGYTLWLWIKKPKSIVINNWLSNLNGWFFLYYLIINAMDAPNQWWYITPIVFSVFLLFISLINNQDEIYDIWYYLLQLPVRVAVCIIPKPTHSVVRRRLTGTGRFDAIAPAPGGSLGGGSEFRAALVALSRRVLARHTLKLFRSDTSAYCSGVCRYTNATLRHGFTPAFNNASSG